MGQTATRAVNTALTATAKYDNVEESQPKAVLPLSNISYLKHRVLESIVRAEAKKGGPVTINEGFIVCCREFWFPNKMGIYNLSI